MVAETSTFLVWSHQNQAPAPPPLFLATSAFRVAGDILRQQGLIGLYQGLSPAVIRHLFYTLIRIVGYERLGICCWFHPVAMGSLFLYPQRLLLEACPVSLLRSTDSGNPS